MTTRFAHLAGDSPGFARWQENSRRHEAQASLRRSMQGLARKDRDRVEIPRQRDFNARLRSALQIFLGQADGSENGTADGREKLVQRLRTIARERTG